MYQLEWKFINYYTNAEIIFEGKIYLLKKYKTFIVIVHK
jgi:hypothetical protein